MRGGGGERGGKEGGEASFSPLVISGNQDLTWEENWEMGKEEEEEGRS